MSGSSRRRNYTSKKISETALFTSCGRNIVDFENSQNPFAERRKAIQKWRDVAVDDIEESEELVRIANELTNIGLKAKDALHVACAVAGEAEYFLTTDDGILKKLVSYHRISVLSPTEFISILEKEL